MKKRVAILFLLLLVLLASGLTVSCSDKKISLQLRLKKGKTYAMRMVTEQQISQKIQGNSMDVSQTIGLGYNFEASEVDKEGTSSVKVTYDWAMYKQKSPLGSLEYDSDKRPRSVPPAAQGFAAIVGQGFAMKLGRDGTVKDVAGIDEMVSRMMEKIGPAAGQEKAALERALKDQFGDAAMKESMQNALSVYPDKPVKVGDSWTRTFSLTRGYPMAVDNAWKLKARKKGIAFIDVTSTMEQDANIASPPTGGVVISKMAGTQEGTMEVEEATGWIRSANISQRLSGQVATGSQFWPISVESKLIFEGSTK